MVEKKINYIRVSNQIFTVSVLLVRMSDKSIQFFAIELKGMSLGLTIEEMKMQFVISICNLLQNADEIEFKSVSNQKKINNIIIWEDGEKPQVVVDCEVSHKIFKTIILKSKLCDK